MGTFEPTMKDMKDRVTKLVNIITDAASNMSRANGGALNDIKEATGRVERTVNEVRRAVAG
jgi:hypothetical protein